MRKQLYYLLIIAIILQFTQCKKAESNNNSEPDPINQTDTLSSADTTTVTEPKVHEETDSVKTEISQIQTNDIYVYVSLDSDKKIGVFKLDTISGKPELIQKAPTGGKVGSLAISKYKQFLYAALRSTNEVSSYKIDTITGKLRHINTTPVTDNPVYITPDKSNKYLLTAYYNAGKMAIYPITNDSIIEAKATKDTNIGSQAHYINTSATNKFVYVCLKGSDKIMQYSFDENTGKAEPLAKPSANSEAGDGPRHIAFHSTLPYIYAVGELSNMVGKYTHDATTGMLALENSTSTLPEGFNQENTSADIHITPNGKYLYSSNRGHNSIAAFSINQTNGNLTMIATYKTEPTPREFDITPCGRFLIAGGQGSGKLITYKINQNGSLTKLTDISAGSAVTWVLCVDRS